MSSSTLAKSYPYQGRAWNSSRKDVFLSILVTLLVAAWLAAALYVHERHITLPLDYFDTRLDGALRKSRYNTLVTGVGSLCGAAVGYGVNLGVKHFIKSKLLKQGLTLHQFDHLVYLGKAGIRLKWSWTLPTTLAVFAIVGQFSTATSAAFSSSLARLNSTAPGVYAPLSDNVDQYVSLTLGVALTLRSDLSTAAQTTYTALQAGDNNQVGLSVDKSDQIITLGQPIAPAALLRQTIESQLSYQVPLSDKLQRLLNASFSSGSNVAYANVETGYAEAECATIEPAFSVSQAASFVAYNITTACGTVSRTYSPSLYTAVDTFACTDRSSPTIYFFLLDVAAGTLPRAVTCEIRSFVQPGAIKYLVAGHSAEVVSVTAAPTPVGTDLDTALVQLGANQYWNTYGLMANTDVTTAYALAVTSNVTFIDMARATSATVTGITLVKILDIATNIVNTYTADQVSFKASNVSADLMLEVSVLSIGLYGTMLAWLVLPACALVLVTLSCLQCMMSGTGRTDFTDVRQAMLVGISSQPDAVREGAGSGEYADSSAYHNTRIHYGVVNGNSSAPKKLELMAQRAATRPVVGHTYC